MIIRWRERVGIEPTGDTPCRPLGFEDREGHQYPIHSHKVCNACHRLLVYTIKIAYFNVVKSTFDITP